MLAHWNNSSQVDMSPYLDKLSWFQASQSLLFLHKAVCLAENDQKDKQWFTKLFTEN
jgi:hypothetical protein